MQQATQQRIAPTTEQVEHAGELLDSVPHLAFDWASKEGQQFLRYVEELTATGVPPAWLATELGLDPARLYAVLARYRTMTDYRKEPTA